MFADVSVVQARCRVLTLPVPGLKVLCYSIYLDVNIRKLNKNTQPKRQKLKNADYRGCVQPTDCGGMEALEREVLLRNKSPVVTSDRNDLMVLVCRHLVELSTTGTLQTICRR